MDIYTLSKTKDLPKTMGSVDVLECLYILESVKYLGSRNDLRERYTDPVYIHQWEVIDGILHQKVAWGLS